MSFTEKNTWIYLVLAVALPAVYASIVFPQLASTAPDNIAYAGPLLGAIGAAVVLSILGTIFAGVASPKSIDKGDERDRGIGRRGEVVGYYVTSIGVVAALLLVFVHAPYFWIGNCIYGAFVFGAIASSVVKLVAYRRGY
jgi:hypothetical protein